MQASNSCVNDSDAQVLQALVTQIVSHEQDERNRVDRDLSQVDVEHDDLQHLQGSGSSFHSIQPVCLKALQADPMSTVPVSMLLNHADHCGNCRVAAAQACMLYLDMHGTVVLSPDLELRSWTCLARCVRHLAHGVVRACAAVGGPVHIHGNADLEDADHVQEGQQQEQSPAQLAASAQLWGCVRAELRERASWWPAIQLSSFTPHYSNNLRANEHQQLVDRSRFTVAAYMFGPMHPYTNQLQHLLYPCTESGVLAAAADTVEGPEEKAGVALPSGDEVQNHTIPMQKQRANVNDSAHDQDLAGQAAQVDREGEVHASMLINSLREVTDKDVHVWKEGMPAWMKQVMHDAEQTWTAEQHLLRGITAGHQQHHAVHHEAGQGQNRQQPQAGGVDGDHVGALLQRDDHDVGAAAEQAVLHGARLEHGTAVQASLGMAFPFKRRRLRT